MVKIPTMKRTMRARMWIFRIEGKSVPSPWADVSPSLLQRLLIGSRLHWAVVSTSYTTYEWRDKDGIQVLRTRPTEWMIYMFDLTVHITALLF